MQRDLMMLGLSLSMLAGSALAEDVTQRADASDWVTLSANVDAGNRETQFFEEHLDSTVIQGDSRLELWLPPSRSVFSWGPYVRLAGIASSSTQFFENAWLAAPGAGFQVYPFSAADFAKSAPAAASWLGPVRLFGEYNRTDYWGAENEWRPDEQIRAGVEYWKALYVNDTGKPAWGEIWSGLYWQSANEFDENYDSVIFANSVRAGIRVPNAGPLSALSPYAAVESALTSNDYFWENRLLTGGGLRIAPNLRAVMPEWDLRFVVYAEYLYAAEYYHDPAPANLPDHDVRAGISLSIGSWYR